VNGDEFFRVLIRHLADIEAVLSPAEYAAFMARLSRLQEALREPESEMAAREVVLALKHLLEPMPDGPVSRAVDAFRADVAGTVIAPSPELLAELIEIMRGAQRAAAPPEPDDGPRLAPESQALFDQARRALLAVSALRRSQLPPDLAADPEAAGLIGLADPERGDVYPAFQFDADGRPRPVVQRINRMFRADRDPWAAADWWLGGNSWLGGPPAALLDAGLDDVLEQAAGALMEVD
jgi:hypothetical protein